MSGFIERLGSSSAEASRQLPQAQVRQDDVLAHLRILLNSRQGQSPSAPDYGLPDLTDFMHSLPHGVRALELVLQRVVERYEPRLTDVRLRYQPSDDDPWIAFVITGRFRQTRQTCRFNGSLHPDGSVSVASSERARRRRQQ